MTSNHDEDGKSPALALTESIFGLCKGQTCHDSLVALMTSAVEIIVHSVDSADEAEDLLTDYAERATDIARRRIIGLCGTKPEKASYSVH
jgi:hypothetical protein